MNTILSGLYFHFKSIYFTCLTYPISVLSPSNMADSIML